MAHSRAIPVVLRIALPVAALSLAAAAYAQVPPHSPGTICQTPEYWCWAAQPGAPGDPCGCATPWGWQDGTLI